MHTLGCFCVLLDHDADEERGDYKVHGAHDGQADFSLSGADRGHQLF